LLIADGSGNATDAGFSGYPLTFSSGGAISAAATAYTGLSSEATTEAIVQFPVSRAGTVGALYCVYSSALSGSESIVLTVRHGTYSGQTVTQGATSLACTLNSTNTHTCNDTTSGHAFTVAANDVLDVQSVPSGTPPAQQLQCSVLFQ
jgi:hypothetical protein